MKDKRRTVRIKGKAEKRKAAEAKEKYEDRKAEEQKPAVTPAPTVVPEDSKKE